MKLRIFIFLMALTFAAVATAQLTPVQICLGALQKSGFSILDLDNYGLWFDDKSIMELAQAGIYKGLDDIREYVGFAVGGVSPYMEANPSTGFGSQILPVNMDPTGECVIAFASVGSYLLNPELTPGNYYATLTGYKLNYTIMSESLDVIRVNRADIYYPVPFLKSFFGLNFHEEALYEFFCSTLKNTCLEVWSYNKIKSIAQCTSKFACLPIAEGENARVDGNTQGCRVLHASFASKNPSHCPHLSFLPMYDSSGRIKCQTSAGRTSSELFSEEELAFFMATANNTFYLGESTFNLTINEEPSEPLMPYCRGKDGIRGKKSRIDGGHSKGGKGKGHGKKNSY